jgi:hypothetical protein
LAKTQTTKRERFLPHEYLKFGLNLSFPTVRIDERAGGVIDIDRHLIDLTAMEFTRARLRMAVSVPSQLADRPADELSLVVTVRGPKTRLRRAVLLERIGDAAYEGELQLNRADVWGSVELTPFALDASGLRIASARPWEVRVDRLREAAGGFLEIRYESFSNIGPPQFPNPKNMYQLDAQSEKPLLWLNHDHQEIQGVLSALGNTGWRARAREVLFDHIEQVVTLELFFRVADLCRDSDDPPYDWQSNFIERLLPPLFPEHADHASRLAALQEMLAENQTGELHHRLSAHLQSSCKAAEHVTRLIREIGA